MISKLVVACRNAESAALERNLVLLLAKAASVLMHGNGAKEHVATVPEGEAAEAVHGTAADIDNAHDPLPSPSTEAEAQQLPQRQQARPAGHQETVLEVPEAMDAEVILQDRTSSLRHAHGVPSSRSRHFRPEDAEQQPDSIADAEPCHRHHNQDYHWLERERTEQTERNQQQQEPTPRVEEESHQPPLHPDKDQHAQLFHTAVSECGSARATPWGNHFGRQQQSEGEVSAQVGKRKRADAKRSKSKHRSEHTSKPLQDGIEHHQKKKRRAKGSSKTSRRRAEKSDRHTSPEANRRPVADAEEHIDDGVIADTTTSAGALKRGQSIQLEHEPESIPCTIDRNQMNPQQEQQDEGLQHAEPQVNFRITSVHCNDSLCNTASSRG